MGEHGHEEDREERLRLLLDAVVTIAAGLSLDSVLQRIVVIAGELVDARYAALGVLSEARTGGCARSSTTACPRAWSPRSVTCRAGTACSACSSTDPQPLRLHDINRAPAAYGFPDHHPPMRRSWGCRSGSGIGLRQPLPHREGGWRASSRRTTRRSCRARGRGRRGDRERPAVRRGVAAAALACGDGGDHRPADGRRSGRRRPPDDR